MTERREPVLSPEEEKFAKTLAMKSVVATITHPLATARTLIQLGHEPFPLSTGRVFVVAGRNAYFLPNIFSYVHQLAKERGFKVLFTGIDSALAGLFVQGIVTHKTTQYIDEYYPNIGGPKENENVEEEDLDDHESFRRALRKAIRDSLVRGVAVTAARPFTVVMIRQIAQLIGHEAKYAGICSSLRLIGQQEGPGGLFSGLVPQIIGETLVIVGVHMGIWAVERTILRTGVVENTKDEKGKKELKSIRQFVHTAVPFVLNSFGHPYNVVSTVMAVVGSGLAVSFLPYSPAFNNWQQCYDYLSPHGLKRGARSFLREQTGAVTVGADKQLYASNKYFA